MSLLFFCIQETQPDTIQHQQPHHNTTTYTTKPKTSNRDGAAKDDSEERYVGDIYGVAELEPTGTTNSHNNLGSNNNAP